MKVMGVSIRKTREDRDVSRAFHLAFFESFDAIAILFAHDSRSYETVVLEGQECMKRIDRYA